MFSKMGMSGATKTAEATAALNTVSNEVNSYMDAAAEAEDEYYAETTAAAAEPESDGDRNYTAGIDSDHGLNGKNSLTTDVHLETAVTTVRLDENDTMGDERLDRLSKVLPFTIKGSGSGMYSDTIAEEVFFGNNGEKVLLFSAPEGTDLINVISLDNSPEGTVSEIIFHQNRTDGVPGTTPEGQAVTYYRVEFGNVTELAEGETSTDVNAAVFNKNGSTYLIIFSDIQPVDVIGSVIDVI